MAKDFSGFRDGMQGIHMQLISQKINELKIESAIPYNQENLNSMITSILAANMVLTLEILEAYHDWNSR